MITASSKSKSGEPGDALAKVCPACQSLIPLACRECPECGHVFPHDEMPKHDATADASSTILSQGKAQWVDVSSVEYYIHNKPDSPPSLRAEYHCGQILIYKFWACFEHQGLARTKAEYWWQRATGTAIPRTTAEALQRIGEMPKPAKIQVRPDGKYFSIVGFDYVPVA